MGLLGFVLMMAVCSVWIRKSRFGPTQTGLNADKTVLYTSEFELYHNPISLCSIKVRLCLAELGIEYNSHCIDLIETGSYQNLTKSFAKINPAGTVPVLIHNGHPIYDSAHQIRYLYEYAAKTSPDKEDEQSRAAREKWLASSSLSDDPMQHLDKSAANAIPGLTFPLFAAMLQYVSWWRFFRGYFTHFDPPRPIFFSLLKILGPTKFNKIKPAADLYRQSDVEMNKHLDRLEETLKDSKHEWIDGHQFGIADVSWMSVFERLKQLSLTQSLLNVELRPYCYHYWERCQQRASYKAAVTDMGHPILHKATQDIAKLAP